MSKRFAAALVILAVILASTLAQEPSVRTVQKNDGRVATAEEPDSTRFRVVTDLGILAVFDADDEWDGRDEPASQLAYWHDYAGEQLFFSGR